MAFKDILLPPAAIPATDTDALVSSSSLAADLHEQASICWRRVISRILHCGGGADGGVVVDPRKNFLIISPDHGRFRERNSN